MIYVGIRRWRAVVPVGDGSCCVPAKGWQVPAWRPSRSAVAAMSRFELVRNDLWNQAPFCEVSAPARYLYLWSFLNPLCSMSGLYRVRVEGIALDTGMRPEAIDAALRELVERRMLVFEAGVLWCCARVKYLKAGGPTLARAIARDVAALAPEHPIRVGFLARYGQFSWLRDELRPLVKQGTGEGFTGGQEGATDFPVVEGNTDTPTGLPAGGPMHLHVHGSSRSEENARRAREAQDEIWAYYLDAIYPGRRGRLPSFNEKRRGIVAAALAVRDAETCKLAIDGLARSDYHHGANEQGTTYLDIRYALRGNGNRAESNEERIDRMAASATATSHRRGLRPNLTAADLMAGEPSR